MNLKVLFAILIYYGLISFSFLMSDGALSDSGANTTVSFNTSGIASSEVDTGGFFGTGVSFVRFFTLVTFGYGLPSDTPTFMSTFFVLWQTLVTVFSVGFIISSIWNG